MAFIRPDVIGRASRALFGMSNAYAIGFFALKAEGLSTENWVHVTANNDLTPGLAAIAQ
jgi:nitrogen regulatory protein PII-like uncharacterized protein